MGRRRPLVLLPPPQSSRSLATSQCRPLQRVDRSIGPFLSFCVSPLSSIHHGAPYGLRWLCCGMVVAASIRSHVLVRLRTCPDYIRYSLTCCASGQGPQTCSIFGLRLPGCSHLPPAVLILRSRLVVHAAAAEGHRVRVKKPIEKNRELTDNVEKGPAKENHRTEVKKLLEARRQLQAAIPKPVARSREGRA